MNSVILTGWITTDPELRHTDNGTEYVRFFLKVPRPTRKKVGSVDAAYPSIAAYGDKAKNICAYFCKGKPIEIDGHIQTYPINDPATGKQRQETVIVVDSWHFAMSDKTIDIEDEEKADEP